MDDTLKLCIATWEGNINSFSGNILKGIAKLLVAYGSELNEDVFKDKLGRCSIKELTRSAAERSNGSLGFAEAMISIYNKRQKVPLHIGKLYNKWTVNESDFMEKNAIYDLDEFYSEED